MIWLIIGGRTHKDIVEWVRSIVGATITTIHTIDEFEAFKKKHLVFTLGIFPSANSHVINEYNNFVKDYFKDDSLVFALTYSDHISSLIKVDNNNNFGGSIVVVINGTVDGSMGCCFCCCTFFKIAFVSFC